MGIQDRNRPTHVSVPGRSEQVCVEDDDGAVCDTYEGEAPGGGEEPWLPIETKLVTRSLIVGLVALLVLATLVNIFILRGH